MTGEIFLSIPFESVAKLVFIIPLLRRYYTVKQGKNMNVKRSNKMAEQNVPNFDLFTSFIVE